MSSSSEVVILYLNWSWMQYELQDFTFVPRRKLPALSSVIASATFRTYCGRSFVRKLSSELIHEILWDRQDSNLHEIFLRTFHLHCYSATISAPATASSVYFSIRFRYDPVINFKEQLVREYGGVLCSISGRTTVLEYYLTPVFSGLCPAFDMNTSYILSHFKSLTNCQLFTADKPILHDNANILPL